MFSYKANAICMAGMTMPAGAGVVHRTVGTEFGIPDSSLIMPDFDLTGELSLKIELHMLRPITEKVHSGNGPVSLVRGLCILKKETCGNSWNTNRFDEISFRNFMWNVLSETDSLNF